MEAYLVTRLFQEEVSSVKVVNGRSIDFRCTVCKELPRKLNRSELYRHYANYHFQSNLNDLFGHMKVCPYCNLDLRNVSTASHFGQKHSHVENFLPTEAWIPLKPRGVNIAKTGMKISNSTLDKHGREIMKTFDQVENNYLAFEALWVWPQVTETSTSPSLLLRLKVTALNLRKMTIIKIIAVSRRVLCQVQKQLYYHQVPMRMPMRK